MLKFGPLVRLKKEGCVYLIQIEPLAAERIDMAIQVEHP